jgi:type I restriction-modification system DNA methylase subunit
MPFILRLQYGKTGRRNPNGIYRTQRKGTCRSLQEVTGGKIKMKKYIGILKFDNGTRIPAKVEANDKAEALSNRTLQGIFNLEKEFLNRFNLLCQTRNNWQVWADFITVTAIAISNAVDTEMETHAKREQEYESCIERLGGKDVPAEMFAIIIMAIEENPEQDFLGNLFMKLELGSHWKGQFFTPYHLCKAMSEINISNIENVINKKGWASVNDPACGAGATLIAMANAMKNHNINYQNHALFVAQDIDRITGMMCYIQLSLLECAGYVVIADTLCNPLPGKALFPEPNENHELWFTPMYLSDVWHFRRLYNMMDSFFKFNK